jgi:hypothetical protein
MIYPQKVASLGTRIPSQSKEYRHTQLLKAAGHCCLFASSLRLAHAQNNRSMVGHKGWIKREDCVGTTGLWLIVVDNFCPSPAQQSYKAVVLLLC